MHAGHPLQLLGEGALLQRQLRVVRQVLQVAATAAVVVATWRLTALGRGLQQPLQAGLDHFATGVEHPRLHGLTGQGAADEPGTPVEEGNATAVTGQALDVQALLLAHWDLGVRLPPAGWKRRPLLLFSWTFSVDQTGQWTDNGRRGRK